MWILDFIENNDERIVSVEQNFKVCVLHLARNRNDSLMYFTAREAVENHALFLSNGNAERVSKFEYFSYLSGLCFACDVYSFDGLPFGGESFINSMHAVDVLTHSAPGKFLHALCSLEHFLI